MSKIEDLIGQAPMIEDQLEHIDAIYSRIAANNDLNAEALKKAADELRGILEELKTKYKGIEDVLPDILLKEVSDAVAPFREQKNGVVPLDRIDESLIKKAISPSKFARQLGYANIDRLKAEISRSPIEAVNKITATLFESWAIYSSRIQNTASSNQFGESYTGAFFFAKLLEDVKKDYPREIASEALQRLEDSTDRLNIYINDLTSLSILPEEPILLWILMMVTLNSDLHKFIDNITQTEQDWIQLKLEYDNDVLRRGDYTKANGELNKKNSDLSAENTSLLSKNSILRAENEKIQLEMDRKKQGKEDAGKENEGEDQQE